MLVTKVKEATVSLGWWARVPLLPSVDLALILAGHDRVNGVQCGLRFKLIEKSLQQKEREKYNARQLIIDKQLNPLICSLPQIKLSKHANEPLFGSNKKPVGSSLQPLFVNKPMLRVDLIPMNVQYVDENGLYYN